MTATCMWLLVGAIAGAVAGTWWQGQERGGLVGDLIMGAAGALAAGWLTALMGVRFEGGGPAGPLASLAAAGIGAVLVIAVARAQRGHSPD